MRASGDGQPSGSRAVLTYNVYRLGLLLIFLGIGWAAGLPGIVTIIGALFVSGVLSWFLLRRQREAMGEAVERTVSRGAARMAARAAAEDGYVDSVIAANQSAAESSTSPPPTTSGDQQAL
jgi:hypothetical protein